MSRNKRKKTEVALLSPRQERAVLLLASGKLKREVAADSGVHPQAVSVWLRQKHFQSALDATRTELTNAAMRELREMTASSVSSLREILQTGTQSLRLRAAMYTLDRLLSAGAGAKEGDITFEPDLDEENILHAIGLAE